LYQLVSSIGFRSDKEWRQKFADMNETSETQRIGEPIFWAIELLAGIFIIF